MNAYSNEPNERLLHALAEQLKMPLIQIARSAELAKDAKNMSVLHDIEYTADMALRLVDSYLLSVQLQSLPNLELEPVSLSAVLDVAASELQKLAGQYGCDLSISLSGRYEPVMAHRQALEAAYISLGYAFIEATPPNGRRHSVVFAAHRSNYGLVAGVYGDQLGWSSDVYRRGRALYGQAHQALPALSASSGAGIFVADSLLHTITSSLRMGRHHNLSGVAATLLPSRQLQLI